LKSTTTPKNYSALHSLIIATLWGGLPSLGLSQTAEQASAVQSLTKTSNWELVASTPLQFPSYHPQGLVKIGDYFFMSSVETTIPPIRINDPQSSFDRTPGTGIGHLFKFAQDGSLLDDLILGEGTMYHPGGIDFDGEFIWASVAEYRPNSQSIVYKIDPETMQPKEVFRFPDHLGSVVKDFTADTLYAVNWGSRKFYQWVVDTDAGINAEQQETIPDSTVMRPNRHHYIDYQDCQWLPPHNMLCSGLSTYSNDKLEQFKLGGIELLELPSFQVTMQLPITKTTDSGVVLTQNPFYFETNSSQEIFMHFVPEDDSSTLFSYRVIP
jgi:hypothetical protein